MMRLVHAANPCQYADEDGEPCTDTQPESRVTWPEGRLYVCLDHLCSLLVRLRDLGLHRVTVELLPAEPMSRVEMTFGARRR